MSRTPRTALVGTLVLAAALAGCGGGDDEKATDTTIAGEPVPGEVTTVPEATTTAPAAVAAGGTTTTARPGTATTRPGGSGSTAAGGAPASTTTLKPTAASADVGTARGYLLTQPDLGAGYEKADNSGSSAAGSDFDLEKCGKGNPVYAKENPNRFAGDAFTKGSGFDSVTTASGSTVAASTSQATEAMAIAKTEEFLRCIEEQAKAAAQKQAPPGSTVDVKASRRPLTGADEATAIHLVGTFTSGVTKFTIDIDIFAYRKAKFLVLATAAVFGSSHVGEPARIAEIQRKKIG